MKKVNDEMNLTDDKDYCLAMKKLEELKSRLSKFQTEETALLAELRTINTNSLVGVNSILDRQVNQLLSDEEVERSPDLANASTKINDLRAQMRIHKRAIEKQEAEIQGHRGRVSSEICKGLMPQHRANVRGILRGVINLYHAQASERELRFGLEVRGIVAGKLIGMPDFIQFGRLNDTTSKIRTVVREYFDRGFVSEKEVEKILAGGNI